MNGNNNTKPNHLKNFAIIAAATAGAWYALPALGRALGSGWEEGATNRYGRLPGRRDHDEEEEECSCGG